LGLVPQIPHQNFNYFMENQRQRHIVGQSPEDNYRQLRVRGWSNDTFRNQGGHARYGKFNSANHRNGRRWISNSQGGTPPRPIGDPIYILTNQGKRSSSLSRHQIPPQQRIVSDPNIPRDDKFGPSSSYGAIMNKRPISNDVRIINQIPMGNYPRMVHVSNDPRRHSSEFSASSDSPFGRGRRSNQSSNGAKDFIDSHGIPTRQNANGSMTFFYSGPARKINHDQSCGRTVFISGVESRLFKDHTLKAMMSECGTVDTISYMFGSCGQTFVAFMEDASVEHAIKRWDGYTTNTGLTFKVSVPNSRDRSSSNASQRSYYSSFRPVPTTADSIDATRSVYHSRHGSFRSYPSRSNEAVHVRQASSESPSHDVPQVRGERKNAPQDSRHAQHQVTLNHAVPPDPLVDIRFFSKTNGKYGNEAKVAEYASQEGCNGVMLATSLNQKENLPITPRKSTQQASSGNKRKTNKHRKDGSRQIL
jgi:hypothetical protein